MNPALLAELVRQSEEQRAAAAERARVLIAQHAELASLASKQGEAVQQSIEMLALKLQDVGAILKWLQTEQPDLGMRTPMDVMRGGHADAVAGMLLDALKGIPS